MSNEIILEFRTLPLVGELQTFPIVYIAVDTADLSVLFKILIPDSLQGDIKIDDVKHYLTSIVKIDEWETERDVSCRITELYGIKNLSKQKFIDGLNFATKNRAG